MEQKQKSLNPLKRVKFISIEPSKTIWQSFFRSQSPQTGQVYFNLMNELKVKSNDIFRLNPLKRVKFISIGKN